MKCDCAVVGCEPARLTGPAALHSALDVVEVDDFFGADGDEVFDAVVEGIGWIGDQRVLPTVLGCGKVGRDGYIRPTLGSTGEKSIAHVFERSSVVACGEDFLADKPVVGHAIEAVGLCRSFLRGGCGAGDAGVKSGEWQMDAVGQGHPGGACAEDFMSLRGKAALGAVDGFVDFRGGKHDAGVDLEGSRNRDVVCFREIRSREDGNFRGGWRFIADFHPAIEFVGPVMDTGGVGGRRWLGKREDEAQSSGDEDKDKGEAGSHVVMERVSCWMVRDRSRCV